ncbi:MAG: TIGR02281 family clan AA aspartic protease [Gammaproteobacteria bacterium]|nr:TIGR02281 family clan AA aspartic protease [Gammaproteobacteria bacterium]
MNEQDENPHRHISGWMWLGLWLIVLGLLINFFHNWLEKQRNPNQNVSSMLNTGDVREVMLKRNRYGHYNVTGKINGHKVEFLLDTGATFIAIPEPVANRIGLKRLYQTEFHTANGLSRGYGTKLDSAAIGQIELQNLDATITTNMDGDIVLLGMGFLKHIEFTQRGDTLILRQ